MSELTPIIEQSFTQYAGAVLQSRALVDVRDCLKPSARQIFYALYTDKFTSNKPYKKTLKAVGSLSRFYIHGDASAVGILMRAGQSFAMRYPIADVQGNAGTLLASGNWAHQRYTETRLAEISNNLFADVDKETIAEWRDNYDDTEKYPAVLPSKGYYNIVNGTMGIGIGLASSIPQFNLVDVNRALINLIQNPDCDFDDIYCVPDFATGAILLNEKEVKESLKTGTGSSCRLRSVVEFDSKDRALVVTEIPYGVYTNTICKELDAILEDENNPGIDRYNDLTGKTVNIKIYLTKRANPDRVLTYLFKNTSLQSWYSINMTMLDQGRYPKVFGWREALEAHIDHEKIVYRNGYLFDLKKIKARLHIIEGLFICLARIDEVVQIIKKSKSTAEASLALQKNFVLDAVQAKAVLDMKLSRLAHLEVEKLEEENAKLEKERERLEAILSNEELFNNELIKGWEEVSKKFGDARRTRIMNIASSDEEEPTEIKQLQVSLTNQNNLVVTETSTLYTQRRGGVGNKMKLAPGEYVLSTYPVATNEEILMFTKSGLVYHYPVMNLTIDCKTNVQALVTMPDWEKVCAITSTRKKTEEPYIIFFTKKGMIKKSELSEYNMTRKGSQKALTLDEGDEIINVIFTKDDRVGLLTEMGNFVIVETNDIRAIGRIAKGVKGIKLNPEDNVASARAIPKGTQMIVSISGNGLFKRTESSEFTVQGRGTKGAKIQRLTEGDWMADFYPVINEKDILVTSTNASIKLSINDVPILSKGAQGNKSIKLGQMDNVVGILVS